MNRVTLLIALGLIAALTLVSGCVVIEDGEVMPACAQACPSNAIVFGNLLDENSNVYKWSRSERSTRLLEELGTSPGVFYLSRKGNNHGA